MVTSFLWKPYHQILNFNFLNDEEATLFCHNFPLSNLNSLLCYVKLLSEFKIQSFLFGNFKNRTLDPFSPSFIFLLDLGS